MNNLLTLWMALSLAIPVPQISHDPAALTPQAPSSKIWIGHYAEFEEFLKTAKIERTEPVKIGVLGPKRHAFFAPGGLAKGAMIKKLPPGKVDGFFESYKSEIAAYRLDRLLQLDMVPPTVERRVDGDMASVQLWVENTRMLSEIQARKLRSPDAEEWNRQLHRAYVFDDLVGNPDENAGNLLFDPAWNFIKIDHSRACIDSLALKYPLTQIDRPFFDRIKALDQATVKRELGDLLEVGALGALFRRRDAIVKTFEELARKNGEARVFTPWPDR